MLGWKVKGGLYYITNVVEMTIKNSKGLPRVKEVASFSIQGETGKVAIDGIVVKDTRSGL